MRSFIFGVALLCLASIVFADMEKRDAETDAILEDTGREINGVETLRKHGIGDDHIIVDVPKPNVHYFATEPKTEEGQP